MATRIGAVAALVALLPGGGTSAGELESPSFAPRQQLRAPDGAEGDNFGRSLAIEGDLLVVGAYDVDDLGPESGAVYVYERGLGQAGLWTLGAKLLPDDGSEGDRFGVSAALSDRTIVVGSYRDSDLGLSSGSAYVFEKGPGAGDPWLQVAKLTADDGDGGDNFGISVDVSGDTVVVGAWADEDLGSQSGSAYVFRRRATELAGGRTTSSPWSQVAKLLASDGAPTDEFGLWVSISGDWIAVGSHIDDDLGDGSGAVYLYHRDAGGPEAWGEVIKRLASDGEAGDFFGWSVDLDGETLIVGAPGDDEAQTDTGSVYVLERDAGGPSRWGQTAKLTSIDSQMGDCFGYSVSVAGDSVVIGGREADAPETDSGAAYVFRRDPGGADTWTGLAKLQAPDGAAGDELGFRVAAGDGVLAVSAWLDDAPAGDSGSVSVFEEVTISPALMTGGSCPGPLDIRYEDGTPGGLTTLYWSTDSGSSAVSTGWCAGTHLDLSRPHALGTLRPDLSGSIDLSLTAPPPLCGLQIQALDLTSCAVSNPESLP